MLENNPSHYRLIEYPRGFRIEGENRNPVSVELRDTFLSVDGRSFGFYTYYALSRYIANQLMAGWTPPPDKLAECRERLAKKNGVDLGLLSNYQPKWLKEWAVTQTAKAIGKRVHSDWKRLLTLVDPDVLAVHRAVYAATTNSATVTAIRLYTLRNTW